MLKDFSSCFSQKGKSEFCFIENAFTINIVFTLRIKRHKINMKLQIEPLIFFSTKKILQK